jgi:sugar lactone lactonase YvrE
MARTHIRSSTKLPLLAMVLGAVAAVVAPASGSAQACQSDGAPIGSGELFSGFSPGFPEGIVVDHDRVFISGPATFGTAGQGPSQIKIHSSSSGAALGTISITGEDLLQEHALSCITTDHDGVLYALSTQLGVVRLEQQQGGTWSQEVYSPLPPNLPSCTAAAPGAACSPTVFDLPPLPNDLAFDAAGNLYVTDSFQATIFRVPAGGGAPEIWFQSPQLEAPPGQIGTNGARVGPYGHHLFFTVTAALATSGSVGTVYKVPLVVAPRQSDLQVVHTYSQGEGPDGIAFGAHGDLYVALAVSNQISLLASGGWEVGRISGPTGSSVPLDAPANIAFDGCGSLLVTNHAAISKNPAHFGVLRITARDPGLPLFKPSL